MGGALAAVAPDFTRAALGVPAMRYSILLHALGRLTTTFRWSSIATYTDELSQPLPVADPDALGPRRAERLRAPDDDRPAAEHPAHTVLMGVGLRRSPGHELDDRRRGADDRRLCARSGRRPRPLAGHRRALGHPADRHLSVLGFGVFYSDFGPSAPTRQPARRRSAPRRRRSTNVPNRVGEDPHGAPRAALAERAGLELPPGRRRDRQPLRPEPCYAGTWTGP